MLRGLIFIIILGVANLVAEDAAIKQAPFDLSIRELLAVQPRTCPEKITTEQLDYWNKIVADLTSKEKPVDALRVHAYLSSAQKAFADSAYIITGSYCGSLDPISEKTLQLFYPDFKNPKEATKDPFTLELTNELFTHVKSRFEEESKEMHLVEDKAGDAYWQGEKPYDGTNVPSMKPWVIDKADQFRLAKPSEEKSFWQNQIQQVEKMNQGITEKQKERVLFWAGKTGAGSGDWCVIVNNYMREHNVPLDKRLEVCQSLAFAMLDASIAAYDTKYTYWIKRPVMLNPQLKTVVPTPNHPSFPSAHSTIGTAAAMVLTYYFPENKQQWEQLAEEAGLSRIWGGIHFPVDHESGKKLGHQVGEKIINK